MKQPIVYLDTSFFIGLLENVAGRRDGANAVDAYHIATAHVLRADRVYSYDDPWNEFPRNEIPNIGEIIVPARVVLPEMPLLDSLDGGK